jgi:hypothetical protein
MTTQPLGRSMRLPMLTTELPMTMQS